jgi:SAM-dependent methyltransferase
MSLRKRSDAPQPEPPAADALAANREAVEWYAQNASYYASLLDPHPPRAREGALRRLAACIPEGGTLLEIGSASGRDADFLESLGVRVRRSDVTRAFIELQAERGKQVECLDLLRDDLGGPHAGVLALCVLLHVPRDSTDAVLARIAACLAPGGAFLVSVREQGDARATAWASEELSARLASDGLRVTWEDRDFDGDHWHVFLARK